MKRRLSVPKRGRVLVRAAGLAVATGLLLLPVVPASAQTTIGTFEGSVPIETVRGAGFAVNRIVVEAQEPGSVVMEFNDVVLSESRSWEVVDVGTTPFTLLFRISPDPAVVRYEGDMVGTRQTFDVLLRAQGLDDLPRAGFITYTFVPDSASSPDGNVGIRQGVAARVRLGAWPADLEGIPAAIEVSGLRLESDRGSRSSIVDRVIPDLPRVINRGPAVVRARTTNVGEVLVQSETTLRLARLPWVSALPFVSSEGFTVITYIDRPRLLLPGEGRTSGVASTASLTDGEEIDRLPFIGLVRVSVDSTAFLGASRDEASESAVYLVAPWKETLLVVLAYLVVRSVRARRRHRRDDSGHPAGSNGSDGSDAEEDLASVSTAGQAAPAGPGGTN
jgi:hypothetical protein